MKEIYLAGGCFWGTEAYLEWISGVRETEVGYANGGTQNPTYEQVCHQNTGHAETVRVVYDDAILPLAFLLDIFYKAINPVTVNRQGLNVGTQYRSGVYYTLPEDAPIIQNSLKNLEKRIQKKVAIECLPLQNYSPAEKIHQKYLKKNPERYCHISQETFQVAKNIWINPSKYK